MTSSRPLLPAEYPPSVLILYEPEGEVVFSAPTQEELQRAAADILTVRFLADWYPPKPASHLTDVLRDRIIATVTRHVSAPPPSAAWLLLSEASRVYQHRVALVPLTPVRAYAARRNPAIGNGTP